jgi:flagellar hook-associated protein 2
MPPLRLSGLASGMDTEAVIEQLMKAERLKTTKVQNKITTTEWKQDKWKDLNKKIYSFYTNQLSKLRMQGNFDIKKATSSNTSKVEVTAANTAPEGTHIIKVKQLASSQFLTGAKIDKDINLNTKLSELGLKAEDGVTIHINAEKSVDFEVNSNSTVGDFINALRSAGLNANYDTVQKRFFISSKKSGVENQFTMYTSSSETLKDKNAVLDFIGYGSLSSQDKNKVNDYLASYLKSEDSNEKNEILENLTKIKFNSEAFINEYMADEENKAAATAAVQERLKDEYPDGVIPQEQLEEEVQKELENDAKTAAQERFDSLKNELEPLMEKYADQSENPASESVSLSGLGLGEIRNDSGTIELSGVTGAVLVNAKDAIIEYNGAELTGSSNNFSVNGLNLNLKGITAVGDADKGIEDDVISISITNDTQAVYDMVKDFVKSYNELLTEMNEAYYAASARGYDPLTDEEKETMTEEQIKKWEDKIKDALLRRDDTLGSLLSMFRTSLSEGVKVGDKTYSLASFGIMSGDYSEKGILHIHGDEDFAKVASNDNKLMEALSNNPEEVRTVLNTIADKLYSSLMNKMKSTTLSSALTVYNDKELSKTLDNHKSDLKKLEAKLAKIEEKYYKQFAAMESAMAKMNAQSSSLMSMLGINTGQN